MMELAHFYGWTLDYIRSLKLGELDVARDYLIQYNKNEGGK